MQPTDYLVRSVFVFPRHEGREGGSKRGSRVHQGLVSRNDVMKVRLMRIVLTLTSVAMIALAGGASLRGF